MKRKFKLYISIVLLFISCTKGDRITVVSEYYLVNNTNKTITLTLYKLPSLDSVQHTIDSLSTYHIETVRSMGVAPPRYIDANDSCAIVYNNNRIQTFTKINARINRNLLSGLSYVDYHISTDKKRETLLRFYYTFTEEDYENAKPIP